MRDEPAGPEDLEAARVASVRYGRDEVEEGRLMALGRRAEALLASGEAPRPFLAFFYSNWQAQNAWAWIRSALEEK